MRALDALALAALQLALALGSSATDPGPGSTAQEPERVAAPASPASAASADEPDESEDVQDPRERGMLRFERAEGELPILIPRDEELVYEVRLDLGLLGEVNVGTVTLTGSVEPHRESALLLSKSGEAVGERGRLVAHAKGGYAVYSVEHTITSLYLPQEWPRIVQREVQTGSENRRRELLIGELKTGYGSRFRSNGHCKGCDLKEHFIEPSYPWQSRHHCKKCKRAEHRTWRPWSERALPEGSVDMIGAIYLARSMFAYGLESVTYPLNDKRKLWSLSVRRGASKELKVKAGEFDAHEALLQSQPAAGENAKPEDFEGLFGIHGTIAVWFEATHGVPVQIGGTVPVGPIELDVTIELKSFRGTPPGFGPKPRKK